MKDCMTDRDFLERDKDLTIAEVQRLEEKKRFQESRRDEWAARAKETQELIDKENEDLNTIESEGRKRYGEHWGYVI